MPQSIKQQAIKAICDRLWRNKPDYRDYGPGWLARYNKQMRQAELFYLSMQKRGWKIVPKT